ncbi:nodulin-related protein 1 [Ziziphus jujuba]|uniref:Nodulin-related protein 1 n=1 Tax=Ziziphus jujuba TaxID=326968 RepID=A0ABM3I072_ZIZJJ|nr:nodulin-related protein 1 [Ziziphus jujuba]
MDLLKSLNKATSGGNDSENHAQGHHQQKQQSSNSELLSSAKLMAEAAKSSYGGESDKVDKAKVAAAGADLLDAASKYGKLEEKSFGKYVEKAEEYLHNYHNTHSSTTTGGGVPRHGHSDSAPQTGHTTHSAPSHEGGGGGGGHPDSGDGDSGNKYGEYFKAAEGFLKKH